MKWNKKARLAYKMNTVYILI